MGQIVGDLVMLGWDLEWTVLQASDVGAPHRRARVFVWATRRDPRAEDAVDGARLARTITRWPDEGSVRAGALLVPPRARPARPLGDLWPTPDASVANDSEALDGWEARRERVLATGVNGNGMGTPLAVAVRQGNWPTPSAADAIRSRGAAAKRGEARDRIRAGIQAKLAEQGSKKLAPAPRYDEVFFEGSKWLDELDNPGVAGATKARGQHLTLPEVVQGERLERDWPTPCARDGKGQDLPGRHGTPSLGHLLEQEQQPWPTPTAGDAKASGSAGYSTESGRHPGTTLTDATQRELSAGALRLSAGWTETLMGLPYGWTDPECASPEPRPWPAPRGAPQHPHEPPRLVAANKRHHKRLRKEEPEEDPMLPAGVGRPERHRRQRLKQIGNAVVPAQAALAIERLHRPGPRRMGT